jgi:hypothetical protein
MKSLKGILFSILIATLFFTGCEMKPGESKLSLPAGTEELEPACIVTTEDGDLVYFYNFESEKFGTLVLSDSKERTQKLAAMSRDEIMAQYSGNEVPAKPAPYLGEAPRAEDVIDTGWLTNRTSSWTYDIDPMNSGSKVNVHGGNLSSSQRDVGFVYLFLYKPLNRYYNIVTTRKPGQFFNFTVTLSNDFSRIKFLSFLNSGSGNFSYRSICQILIYGVVI